LSPHPIEQSGKHRTPDSDCLGDGMNRENMSAMIESTTSARWRRIATLLIAAVTGIVVIGTALGQIPLV
jgi:hypothetical protein